MALLGNVLIGIDQTINCLCRLDGEWGQPDETLSARAWRVREKHPSWSKWIDRLFFWDRFDGQGHCEQSYYSEVARRQLPAEYRVTQDETP
jgi:hypothetical protein